MDPPKVRVDRMIEHTHVLKALFGGEPVTFAGEHYRITDLDGTPKPYRPGGPPILIGGGGRRVLRFAAGHADIVGVNASVHSGEIDTAAAQDALPENIDEKVDVGARGGGRPARRHRAERVALGRRGHGRQRRGRRDAQRGVRHDARERRCSHR